MEHVLRTGVVLALFAGVLLAVSFALVRHELSRRERARREQETARSALEQRVAERTAELQQALASLAQSRARLEGIIETATDAILTADASQTIVMANPAAATLLGTDPAAIVGAPLERFVPTAQRERHRAEVARFGASGQSARAMGGGREVVALRGDGREIPVDVTVSQLQFDGQPLYTAILRDCSERRRAQSALRDSEARLRRLVANQEQVREGERVRIARELHDDLQQTLAAIKLDLVSAAALARQQSPQLGPLLATLDELVGNAIVSTRRIVNDLRPQLLDDLGLVAALRSLGAQFEQRNGIAVRVMVSGLDEDEVLPAPVSICLYRVAQEALHNVAKHARARHVELRLAHTRAGRLRLRVRDDGQGLAVDAAAKPQSFGLMGMRERVRALHGEVRISGRAGEGTTVEASLPWVPEDQPSAVLP
jgi:PAS domain S-box-containing protein